MKKPPAAREKAMTLLEVLVVIVVIGLVFVMVIPPQHRGDKTRLTGCMSNLRQIDLGFLMYADDNKGKLPMQFSMINGGTMEFLSGNHTFPHYKKLSQYIRRHKSQLLPQRRCVANESSDCLDSGGRP